MERFRVPVPSEAEMRVLEDVDVEDNGTKL